jgi:hypothetical protein
MEAKQVALAQYLECDANDLEQASHDKNLFECGMESYLVLDDDEADKYVQERILEDLWAFNTEFIIAHSRIEVDEQNEESITRALKKMQEKLCEDAQPIIRALLKDEEEFVSDAVEADGRGHFLSGYDGEENEVTHEDETFYIYRQN